MTRHSLSLWKSLKCNNIAIAKAINSIVTKINSVWTSVNSALGMKVIPTLNKVSEAVSNFGVGYASSLVSMKWQTSVFVQWFKEDWSGVGDIISNGFGNLWNYISESNANIDSLIANTSESAIKWKNAIDATTSSALKTANQMNTLNNLIDEANNKTQDWWKKASESAKWAGEATKDLKEEVDKLKDSYKKYEDQQDKVKNKTMEIEKAHKSMTDNIKKWVNDTIESIQKLSTEYQKTIDNINKERDKSLSENVKDLARTYAEKYSSTSGDLIDIEDRINQANNEQKSIDEINKLYEEQKKKKQELVDIERVLWELKAWNEQIVKEELSRASLSWADRDLLDFNKKQSQIKSESEANKLKEEEKYKVELDRLEKTKQVYEFFDTLQITNYNKLAWLKTEAFTSQLNSEQLALFNKLMQERLEYANLIQEKRNMEQDLQNSIITLSNQTTAIQKANINSLGKDYQKLVSQIKEAIVVQQQLNSMRSSWVGSRYLGGPVEAWMPYLVGENPDGSINPTSELFIPNTSWTIVSASKIRDAMSSVTNSNDNSKKFEINNPIFHDSNDLERMLERLLFRM